jgi:hypothetical protein
MRIRALVLAAVQAAAVVAAISSGAACTHPSAHLMVDSPKLLPYQPPDINEITGIEPPEDADETAAPAPAQNPQQPPHK